MTMVLAHFKEYLYQSNNGVIETARSPKIRQAVFSPADVRKSTSRFQVYVAIYVSEKGFGFGSLRVQTELRWALHQLS